MKNIFAALYIATSALALSACSMPLGAEADMQGIDPNAYYNQHPIENKVEARKLSQAVHFIAGSSSLPDDEIDNLRRGLRGVSPAAVDSIIIRLGRDDQFQLAREDALAKLVRQMGYSKIEFAPSAKVPRGTALVDVAYLAVVTPDCPDWRMSPVTSHSNTTQGNFRCATATDIGLMIADPHDLVRGTGDVRIDTPRSAKAVQDYESGKDFMPGTISAGTSGGGSSTGGSSSGSSSGGSGGSSGGASGAGGGSGGGN